MAEFLVYNQVPVDLMVGVAVRTEAMRQQVNALLAASGAQLLVRVLPDWYF
jgi:ssDNA thymidine ADP-ribosyltransferase, DarT